MKKFLETNGPWSQLVNNSNITLQPLQDEKTIRLSANVSIRPFLVPHREEYSETVGYRIEGPQKKVLFIPDIDKWEKWKTDIRAAIAGVDYAFIDATFYDAQEINNRDIREIPHPFVVESLDLFKDLPQKEKNKIHFIHLNHTNPLLDPQSPQTEKLLKAGFRIARRDEVFEL
jgi:pyrroloquinoline quinone biosynthesis protein B